MSYERPTPRDILARAFLLSMEYNLGKEVEEVSNNLAGIALKALEEAGYSLMRHMNEEDEKDEW